MRLGLDAMGGDYAPLEVVKGAINYVNAFEKHTIVLFGDETVVQKTLDELGYVGNNIVIVHCAEHIAMHEHGARAVASKKESSINIGMAQHKAGLVDCFISAGNTGAMLAASLFILKAIEGINRPTINSPLPRPNGPDGLMLDVGFNADCKPETLRQFGLLGSIYAKEIAGIDNPRVALLNIGEEKEKGNIAAQQAYTLLEEDKSINFVGNIEGRDLFNSKVADVVVCDGFTGNIVLKTAEGLFYEISKSGAKSEFLSKINFENYAGIPVLGVDGNAMIGHGISKADTFYKMLQLAASVINHNIVGKIKSAL